MSKNTPNYRPTTQNTRLTRLVSVVALLAALGATGGIVTPAAAPLAADPGPRCCK